MKVFVTGCLIIIVAACALYPQRVAIFLNGLGIHPHLP